MASLGITLRRTARNAVRQTALGALAGLFLLAGSAFLVTAFWLFLDSIRGPIFASVVIGFALAGIGLLLVAVQFMPSTPEPEPDEIPDELLDQLKAAGTGGSSDLERMLNGLLTEAGLPPPVKGTAPALLAALIFGVTLAMSRRRR